MLPETARFRWLLVPAADSPARCEAAPCCRSAATAPPAIYLGPLPAINHSYSATSFALPMTRGVRSWMDSGCKSRIRCVPVLPRRNTQQKRKTLPQGGVFFSLSVVSFFPLHDPPRPISANVKNVPVVELKLPRLSLEIVAHPDDPRPDIEITGDVKESPEVLGLVAECTEYGLHSQPGRGG